MRHSSLVAGAVFAVVVVAMALALVLTASFVDAPFTPDLVFLPAAYLAFAAVGAMIVARRPENPIGQLSLAAGAIGALAAFGDSYTRAAIDLPAREWAAWVAAVGFPASLGPTLFVLLLFPTGRLASRRWRLVAAPVALGMVLITVGNAFSPRFADYPVANPIGVAALAGSPVEQGGVAWFLVVFGAIAGAVGLIPRLRGSTGIERLQLKWVTYAAALNGIAWLVLALEPPGVAGEVAQGILFGTLTLIPIATGIAILRYRLYEIDVVIRRTLVYGLVVGVLGAIYVVLVVGLQAVLAGVTGNSTVPVALSTLAIAALFTPVRTRVRDVIDRRFYRSRYDAQRTLEAFAGRLRDEVELDAVAAGLRAAANEAVRPASASVWVRQRSS